MLSFNSVQLKLFRDGCSRLKFLTVFCVTGCIVSGANFFKLFKVFLIFLLDQVSLHYKLTNLSCPDDAPGVSFIQILVRERLMERPTRKKFPANFIQID